MGSVDINSNQTEAILDIFNQLWKFFVSVRLTVVLLLSLAATSIIGTLIPQNKSPEEYYQAFGDFLYRLFDVLDVFDMYHAWWFQSMVILLALNIVVCSIDRLSATWKIIFVKNPSFKAARFRKRKGRQEFKVARPPEGLRVSCETAASRKFGQVHTESSGDGFLVFAERWRWSRLGVYIVHSSIVILLIGGLVGSIFGFDGFVNIPEGETVDEIRLTGTNRTLRLPFGIRCNDFDVSFYKTGQPKEFRSSLALIKDGKTILEREIIVNDPLRFQGINIFQASYGQMDSPAPAANASPPTDITLKFTVRESGKIYEEKAEMGRKIVLPEGKGTFELKDYNPSAEFRGQQIGEALMGVLTRDGREPVMVMLPVRFAKFDMMRKGDLVISVADHRRTASDRIPHQPQEPRYFTGLQVTRDPGVWMVYTGFILMILGCFVTFFMSHQQLCIEVNRGGKGSRVMVAGISNRNRVAMQNIVNGVAKTLAAGDELMTK